MDDQEHEDELRVGEGEWPLGYLVKKNTDVPPDVCRAWHVPRAIGKISSSLYSYGYIIMAYIVTGHWKDLFEST